MSLIGHSEFGLDYVPQFDNNLNYSDSYNLNHWLEQWYLTYNMLNKFLNYSQVLLFAMKNYVKIILPIKKYWLSLILILLMILILDYRSKKLILNMIWDYTRNV